MILFLGIFLITIACIWFGHWWEKKHTFSTSPIGMVAEIMGFLLAIVAVIMLVCVVIEHSTAQEAYATKMAEYEGLTYIIENIDEDYLDDFDIRKAEVVNKILEWNVKITKNREICDNPWIGVFYANYWKDIPTIDYSLLNLNGG